MRNLFLLTLITFVFGSTEMIAQKFFPAASSFSHKKVSHIFMEDGSEKRGTIKDLDWKKGLIEEIKIRDMNDKKVKIKPNTISHMYLPPSKLSKLAGTLDFLSDATKWDNTDLDQDIIGKGYAYMEKSEVRIKKKTRTLMLQLINPSFKSKIKVYEDPLAKETASIGIGSMKLAGGLAKSYFVKKAGDKVAFLLKKKNYDEEFKLLFGDCPALMEKYGSNPKWADFETHIFEHSKTCK